MRQSYSHIQTFPSSSAFVHQHPAPPAPQNFHKVFRRSRQTFRFNLLSIDPSIEQPPLSGAINLPELLEPNRKCIIVTMGSALSLAGYSQKQRGH